MVVEMELSQVASDPFLQSPILLLSELGGPRRMVVRVSQMDAVAMVSVLENIPLTRPTCHDLVLGALQACSGRVIRVELEPDPDGTAAATVVLRGAKGQGEVRLRSRVVDAVAIAVRSRAPMLADDSLLEPTTDMELAIPDWATADALEALPSSRFPKYKM